MYFDENFYENLKSVTHKYTLLSNNIYTIKKVVKMKGNEIFFSV